MRILYLGYPENSVHLFLKTKGTVYQTLEKITFDISEFDWIVSYGYSHIIKQNQINNAKNPIINLHISYLPYNKGVDPNFWSWFQDTPKGVTIHQIDEGVDTGDIFIQKEIKLGEGETLASSYNILRNEIEALFVENFDNISAGVLSAKKQKGKGTFHSKKDLEPYKHLLTDGWNTPVRQIKMTLREVKFEDWQILFEWRNDTTTRENSANRELILEESHKEWLKRTLNDPNRKIYILEDGIDPIGTIRADKTSQDVYTLSWSISPNHRNKGYGTTLLRLFLKQRQGIFVANIMPNNLGSIKMAERSGFKQVENDSQNNLLTFIIKNTI